VGKVTPTCIALVLCEAIERPSRGGEASVLRAFEFFEATKLPGEVQPFTVWMQLRNGHGVAAMTLIMEYLPPDDLAPVEIVSVKFSVTFPSPNQVVEHETVMDNPMFEHEGRYRLRLLANGVPVMARDFAVVRTAK
jgi:hypothetical protein